MPLSNKVVWALEMWFCLTELFWEVLWCFATEKALWRSVVACKYGCVSESSLDLVGFSQWKFIRSG